MLRWISGLEVVASLLRCYSRRWSRFESIRAQLAPYCDIKSVLLRKFGSETTGYKKGGLGEEKKLRYPERTYLAQPACAGLLSQR